MGIDFLEYQSDASWEIKTVVEKIETERLSFVFIGDFGAGKSMTLREIFFIIRNDFHKGLVCQFPLYLNLMDHYGQTDPVEALERHGRQIGYERPSQLVRAWRAGYVVVILDGFDEIASAGWYGVSKKLKHLRREAMTLVRRFVNDSSRDVPVVLAGRSNYFDSIPELKDSLGTGDRAIYLTLNEFSDDQVQTFLRRKGLNAAVPDWLPTRPLLVDYLAARGFLVDIMGSSELSQADASYRLWRMICQREALIEANIDAETVQELMESVATKARATEGGLGPLLADQIIETFREIVGHPPDDKAQVLLLRLPGLSAAAADDSSRSFIDEDLAGTARAGDIARFCMDPFNYDTKSLEKAQTTAGQLAASVGALICAENSLRRGNLIAAIKRAEGLDDGGITCCDILEIMITNGWSLTEPRVIIRDAMLDRFSVGDRSPDLSGVIFNECLFHKLEIEHWINETKCPKFQGCFFGTVEGPTGLKDLPSIFDGKCEFD